MSKVARVIVIFLLIDAIGVGVYFGAKACRARPGDDPANSQPWTTMDSAFEPASELEQFIKTDYEEKGLLPLQFRNFGRNPAILKRFRGSKLVGANVTVVEMTFKSLEDWAVVDVWIKGQENREIRRTILYVLAEGAWRVGDSGRLVN